MEEMTMEVAVELLKAVAESTGDAAEITEAVATIIKVAMEITEALTEITEEEMEITEAMMDIIEAEMEITEAVMKNTEAVVEVLEVMVEVSEITKTNMIGNIKMDCHEEVDSQEGEVIKALRLASFVMMAVYAELSGRAWAALTYTS